MKFVLLFLCMGLFSIKTLASNVEYEAKQMGTMYALASFCGEDMKRLNNFELIASRVIANQCATEEEETSAKIEFERQKLKTYKKFDENPSVNCFEVLDRFGKMSLFQSVVYADGGIKMPDGQYLPPQRPFQPPTKKK